MISTRLRGPEDQDYDLELDAESSETSGKWNVRFTLRGTPFRQSRVAMPRFADRQAAIGAQRAELEAKIAPLQERYNENHPEVQQLKSPVKCTRAGADEDSKRRVDEAHQPDGRDDCRSPAR